MGRRPEPRDGSRTLGQRTARKHRPHGLLHHRPVGLSRESHSARRSSPQTHGPPLPRYGRRRGEIAHGLEGVGGDRGGGSAMSLQPAAFSYQLDLRTSVATITLNRPERLNALTFDVYT